MAATMSKTRTALWLLLGCATIRAPIRAQTGSEAPPAVPFAAGPAALSKQPASVNSHAPAAGRPLPDIVAMMRDVETNERKSETIVKDYLYHSVGTHQEVDGHGRVKKTTVVEADHFWVNGVPVHRVTRRDGKDLSPAEIAKENERIDKESAKDHERREKADTQGKKTDPRGNDLITVSRLLELGSFSNARRVQMNGRDTIAVDFAGDPKAKTRNRGEEVVRDLVGTAWIDEQDRVLVRVEGHFVNAFKIAGGLIADIRKDTRFSMAQTKVNDEVWLPAHIDGQGAARFLLFLSLNGSVNATYSDYRKFRATSTVLPGITRVDPPEVPGGPTQP
jgi:hypothetical protein